MMLVHPQTVDEQNTDKLGRPRTWGDS